MRMRGILLGGIFLLVFSRLSYCEEGKPPEPSPSDSDPWTTSTVTHIEYNPFGLIKTEVNRLGSILKPQEVPSDSVGINEANVFGLAPGATYHIPPYKVERFAFLRIPFLEWQSYHRYFKEFQEAGDANPFEKSHQIDQPLFALWDGLVVTCQPSVNPTETAPGRKTETRNFMSYNNRDESPQKQKMVRERFLDSLVFCFYEKAKWGEGNYYKEWLNAPMVTTLARKKTRGSSSWQVLDSIVSVFTQQKTATKNKIRVLDAPVSLLEYDEWGKEPLGSGKNSYRMEWLDLPLVTTFAREEKKEGDPSDAWTILEAPGVCLAKRAKQGESDNWSILTALRGSKMSILLLDFALCDKHKSADKTSSQQFLRLPLLGPVWSSWRGPEDVRQRHALFPRLMFWRYPKVAR